MMNSHPGNMQGPAWCAVSSRCPLLCCHPRAHQSRHCHVTRLVHWRISFVLLPRPQEGKLPRLPLAFICAVLAVVQLLSCTLFFATPWTAACQAPLSMGFSRQEFWSGLPFPSLGDLPGPGIEPASPALVGRVFTTELSGKPRCIIGPQTNIYQMNTGMVVGMAGQGICPVT